MQVGLQRLDPLVAGAAPPLLLEQALRLDPMRESLGVVARPRMERLRARAEGGVEKPDPHCLVGADGGVWRLDQARRRCGADAAGQEVGPVLGAVQAAHVPVVGVQHDVLVRDDMVGRQRQRYAAGAGVSGERRDHEVRVGLHDSSHDVVDRVQVQPRLGGGVVGRLDDVEVDAVGEEVLPAHQHDDLRPPKRARVLVRIEQAPALLDAHGAVVELEAQVADAGVLLVGDLAVGLAVGQRRVERDERLGNVEFMAGEGKSARSRQLEGGSVGRGRLLQLRDPDRAVRGGAADRAVALGDDLARTAAQRALGVGAEEVERGPPDFVQHPGMALGGADLAHDGLGAVRAPVDRPDVLRHQRARPAHRPWITGLDPPGPLEPLRDLVDRLDDRLDGRTTNLVAVQAALAGTVDREGPRRPDVAGIDVARSLEDGDAPRARGELDRPIQRRRATVAHRTRVQDQAAMLGPDRLRDHLLEHRAHDQLGMVLGNGGLHGGGGVDDRDGHSVTELAQLDPRALAEAVVCRYEEEDPERRHRDSFGGFER